jgi:hypothetical protein
MFFSSAMVLGLLRVHAYEVCGEDAQLVAVLLHGHDLVAGALGEARQVLLGGRVVGEHFEDVTDLDRIDTLARLEQRLGTVQPDAVEREGGSFSPCSLPSRCGGVAAPSARSIPTIAVGIPASRT